MRFVLFSISFMLLISLMYGQTSEEEFEVHIIQAGWHTGIVIKTIDLPPGLLKDFPEVIKHKYIDFSWGDEKYYQIPDPNFYIAARSVLWPTQSVINVSAFSRDIESNYRKPEIYIIQMNKQKFVALCRFLAESFKRDTSGNFIESTFYRHPSGFYLSKRKYFAFRTCNTWVALVLKDAGYDINPFLLSTAKQLNRRLNRMLNSD